MTTIYEDFVKKLGTIHDGNGSHSIDDFVKIFDEHKLTLDRAFEANALYPFDLSADDLLETVSIMKDRLSLVKKMIDKGEAYGKGPVGGTVIDLQIGGYGFKFVFRKDDIVRAVDFFDRVKPSIQDNVVRFSIMRDFFLDYINLDVLPNPFFNGEKVYLERGKIIIPTQLEFPGYHVFNISTFKCGDCGGEDVELSPLTKSGLGSLEEAIKLHINPTSDESVAIASNTEYVPLVETVLPVVELKYLKGLKSKNYS
ncbi:MAG: hypothetical protein ABIH63_00480 [archaeon]